MNIVTREEKKFLISIEEFRNKSHYLDSLMIQDEHNGIDGYIIRSLYFDTVYDDDFFEKLEGTETRRKIRLRIYDPKHDFAMLEMKQKQGANQKKRSLRMTKADAEALIAGRYEVLLKYEEDFARECYGLMHYKCYRPKTVLPLRFNPQTMMMREKDRETATKNVRLCKELGFRIYLDDLGSGYTSLANLCDYPIDVVKIDRDILLKTDTDKGKDLFSGIIALAHSLNIKVICEGVETEEQNTLVSSSACDFVQGWYYSKALPLEECESFISKYYAH